MPILTETFDGVPGGMNLALPAQQLGDDEARYLQDILLDYPGITRRRGPVKAKTGYVTFPNKASGLVETLDPNGVLRVGVLNGDSVNGYFSVISDDGASKVDLPWNGPLPQDPYFLVDAKPALGGGVLIGTSSQYDSGSTQTLAYWFGGNKANYSTGTLTATRGSATVTGSGTSWTSATVVPGMFVFATADDPAGTEVYLGIVKSVDSSTQLTLLNVSPFAATAKAYTIKSLRGFAPKVMEGTINGATTSTTITGGRTKFKDQGLGTGSWYLYKASDGSFVGKVSSVTNNSSLTLTANAAQDLANERYIALKGGANYDLSTSSGDKPGFLNAVYAERQWYANNTQTFERTHQVWFSDPEDLEAVDMSTFDGDFIPITSTTGVNSPIRSLMPAYNGLLVLKENEVHIVTGSSPSNFSVRKLSDDGTLCGMSVQAHDGGVIWAGREGIHYYDGVQVTNLTFSKLGDYYKVVARSFDPTVYRMWSMLSRDHYFLFFERVEPPVAVVKGTVSSTPTAFTLALNLNTRAFTIMTNTHFRGAIELPADVGEDTWYITNRSDGVAVLCDTRSIFEDTGNDEFACDTATAGPDFYFESKKFNAGDGLRRKLFKQLAIHYQVQGDDLRLDTVIGLNNVGKTANSKFPPTIFTWDSLRLAVATWDDLKNTYSTWNGVIDAVFKPKRIKFLKRSQFLSFRIWQETSACNRVTLGPFQIGYKLQRPGRV